MSHTKTPWKREIGNDCHVISGPDRRPVCTVHDPNDGTFIVQAVNSHEALKEALEFVLSKFDTHSDADAGCLAANDEDHAIWAKLTAALALVAAKGKP
jgi:hypothetical protein